jgi:hypothetical protein
MNREVIAAALAMTVVLVPFGLAFISSLRRPRSRSAHHPRQMRLD